ncbi:hypothetical protein EDB92DRAFT_2036857 [Lactarius akahatsu]|uniref:TLC domain-containing protein n=1 Tax=Lactarius akahatsu TaxID=416441 RepID=A0AAD4L837_9AGAM|nr:hypothetical protein EDB92DRAFT_2036857 [Lactarius akahatsu]
MAAILPLRLPDHLHTLLISTVGFAAVHHLAAPEFVRFLLGKKAWDALGTRERVGWWQSRVTSLVHALLILPLTARPAYPGARGGPRVRMGPARRDALRCHERVFPVGFGRVFGAFRRVRVHAARSTPFLNIHWMLDKTGQTGSPLQFVNGLILISTFAGARLVYGSIMSYQFYQTLIEVRDGLSSAILAGYACGGVLLNGLNVHEDDRRAPEALQREKDTTKAKVHITSHTRTDGAAQALRTKKRG